MTIEELRAVLDRLVVELPLERADRIADALPDLVATLEGAKTRALARVVREAVATPPAPAQLIDAASMARQLNVAETWVRDAARRQKIPAVYAGVHLRFDPVEVLDAMKSGRAALPDRKKLSERGRRAVEHRTSSPVKAANPTETQAGATALLPPATVAEGSGRATAHRHRRPSPKRAEIARE